MLIHTIHCPVWMQCKMAMFNSILFSTFHDETASDDNMEQEVGQEGVSADTGLESFTFYNYIDFNYFFL